MCATAQMLAVSLVRNGRRQHAYGVSHPHLYLQQVLLGIQHHALEGLHFMAGCQVGHFLLEELWAQKKAKGVFKGSLCDTSCLEL